jgi:hypothetical protein
LVQDFSEAKLEVIQPFNVPSFALGPEKMLEVYANINLKVYTYFMDGVRYGK